MITDQVQVPRNSHLIVYVRICSKLIIIIIIIIIMMMMMMITLHRDGSVVKQTNRFVYIILNPKWARMAIIQRIYTLLKEVLVFSLNYKNTKIQKKFQGLSTCFTTF